MPYTVNHGNHFAYMTNPQKALMHLPRRHQWGSATRQAKVKPTTFEMKHIHVLTFSLVHFNRKCNLLPVCPSHNNFQCFQADMLKVRRSAVGHSTVNSWRVETSSNETFQILLLFVLIAKGYVLLVNLQKSAFWCLLPYRKLTLFLLQHNRECIEASNTCTCVYAYVLTVFDPPNVAVHPCPRLHDSCPQTLLFVDNGNQENHDLANWNWVEVCLFCFHPFQYSATIYKKIQWGNKCRHTCTHTSMHAQSKYVLHKQYVVMYCSHTFGHTLLKYVITILVWVLLVSRCSHCVARYTDVAFSSNTSANKELWPSMRKTPYCCCLEKWPPPISWNWYAVVPLLREWGATAKDRPSLAWSSPPYQWERWSARGLVTRWPS